MYLKKKHFKRIYIEITNHCNLACPFCVSKSQNDYLSLSNFTHIINQVSTYTDYIYLHILGEPMSHPYFYQLLDIIEKTTLKVQLVTNGTYLNKFDKLLSYQCLRKLSISLHSIDYIKVTQDYFNNIDNLIIQAQNKNNFNLELRFYNLENLKHHAYKYYLELKDKYVFQDTKRKDSYKLKDNVYIYHQKLFKWPNINDKTLQPDGYCLGGLEMLGILCGGDVVLCCLDGRGSTKIGNIFQETMADILKNPSYLAHLENLTKHKLTFELCQKCTYKSRFQKSQPVNRIKN